jgi:YVTN family beta-propeller protein
MSRISRRSMLLAGGAAAGCMAWSSWGCGRKKGTGFAGYAFVANLDGENLAAVDLTAFAVARHIPLEGRPLTVMVHSRQPVVYAVTREPSSLQEVSVTALKRERRLRLPFSPVAVKMAGDGESLWIIGQNPAQLLEVALDTFTVRRRLPLPFEPVAFDLSWRQHAGVISFGGAQTLAFVDLEHQPALRGTARLDSEVGEVRFRSDGKLVMAATPQAKQLSLFDYPDARLMVHLPLAIRPERMAVKQDGGQVFLSGEGMDAVAIVYPYSTEVGRTMLAGRSPGAMTASESPEYLFVSNRPSGEVTVINLSTQKVIAVVRVGADPGAILLTPDQQYALVLNQGSGDVAVIRIAALAARRLKAAPVFTIVPVGSRPVSGVVRGLA